MSETKWGDELNTYRDVGAGGDDGKREAPSVHKGSVTELGREAHAALGAGNEGVRHVHGGFPLSDLHQVVLQKRLPVLRLESLRLLVPLYLRSARFLLLPRHVSITIFDYFFSPLFLLNSLPSFSVVLFCTCVTSILGR